MNFENMHGLPNPIAPAGTEDDAEVIQLAQKWADNNGESVIWTDWKGNITKQIEPEV